MKKTAESIANTPRLLKRYREEVMPRMTKEFGYKNVMSIPRLEKIVLNMGVKEGSSDIKIIDQALEELTMIAGQRPVITRAKKSIASFKLRAGMPIGIKVTLRRNRMYEFLDRLMNVAMPRIRDFRGFSDKSFDDHGNYSMGLQEQSIFPEIEFDKIKKVQGMDITFVTSSENIEHSKKLLEWLGFPFRK
ncbi:MAG: 50S ribosomal protein L5 [Candidatus Omnitrophica bacterium]|nr:50S ribosomal protein L5 [Candidatus Omnitrophota bacterium]